MGILSRLRTPDPARDEWLEQHIARNEARVLYVRLGSEAGGTIDEVREDLRRRYPAYLERELPDEMKAILQELGRFDHHPQARSEEQKRRHRELIDRWNEQWVRYIGLERDTLPPSLTGVSLATGDFSGIDLTNADLRARADLGGYGSDHWRANLSGAQLAWSNLEGNSFNEADLSRADLSRARLRHARLVMARLQGARLIGADLRGAKLDKADLTGADLWGADLTGASLSGAVLDLADLRFARGVVVDRNSAFRTRFSSGGWSARLLRYWYYLKLHASSDWDPQYPLRRVEREDPWSGLRRSYTGPNFFVSLLFLVAFAASFLIRAAVLDEIGRTEAALIAAVPPSIAAHWQRWIVSPEEAAAARARLPGEAEEISRSFDAVSRQMHSLSQELGSLAALPTVTGADLVTSLGGIAARLQRDRAAVGGLQDELTRLSGNALSPDEAAQVRQRLALELETIGSSLADLLQTSRHAATLAGELPVGTEAATLKRISQSIGAFDADLQRMRESMLRFRSDLLHWLATSVSNSRYRIWEVMIGLDTGHYAATALIVLLLIYNGLRGFLTTTVAPMRDLEDRSHTTPLRVEYYWLRPLDWAVASLFWLSLAVGLSGFLVLMDRVVYVFW